MKLLVTLLSSLVLFSQAFAIGDGDPPIKKGASVQVKTWDPLVQAVDVKIVNEPEVGPNFADIDVFIKALGFSDKRAKEMKENPASLQGVVFNLKSSLVLLNYKQLKARLPKDMKKNINKLEAKGRTKAKTDAKKNKKQKKKK